MKINELIIAMLLTCTVGGCYAINKEEVTFQSGSLRLAGTVLLPKGEGPFPSVVFLHGSGESTREQNEWRAKKFVKQGYIALIYDKRGTGESEGVEDDWRYFSFDSLAQDAIAAVDYLKTRNDVNQQHIGIVAASQSGWVAPLAASRSKDISFMVVISASVSTVAEDRLFERAARLKKEGFSNDEVSEATEMQMLDQAVTRDHSNHTEFKELWEKNKNKRWFPRVYISDYFLNDPTTNPYRNWYKQVIDFDPLPLLNKIDIPILWLFGDPVLDRFGPVQKSIERLNELKTKGKRYTIIQYQHADHNLKGADYLNDIFEWLRGMVEID